MQEGLTEDSVEAIGHFEESDLPERQKAALRVTRAFLTDPRGLSAGDRAEMLRHFSEQEVIDLVFYLAVVEVNKTTVTLGLDAGPVHAVFREGDAYYT